MQSGLSAIYKILKARNDFFSVYQDTFIDSFQNHTEQYRPGLLTQTALNNFGAKLYNLLFSFRNDPRSELKAFTATTISCNVDIKPILLKSLLLMIGDFTHYCLKKIDVESAVALAELVKLYAHTIDEVHKNAQKTSEESDSPAVSGTTRPSYKEMETILEALKQLQDNDETLKAITYVEEVPIVCNVKIVGQSAEYFELDTQSCIASSFKDGTEIYIKHASLPKVISGKAHHFPRRNALRIRNPYFTDLPQEERQFLRVATVAPIPVSLHTDSGTFICRIRDISIGGLGIISMDKLPLVPNTIVLAVFTLNDIELSLDVNIRYNIKEQHFFRIGVSFDIHNTHEEIISKYVTDRQFEILKNLRSKASD